VLIPADAHPADAQLLGGIAAAEPLQLPQADGGCLTRHPPHLYTEEVSVIFTVSKELIAFVAAASDNESIQESISNAQGLSAVLKVMNEAGYNVNQDHVIALASKVKVSIPDEDLESINGGNWLDVLGDIAESAGTVAEAFG